MRVGGRRRCRREGLTAREAADLAGVSVSGMKSRVKRGRAQLRVMFAACRALALDAPNKFVEFAVSVRWTAPVRA